MKSGREKAVNPNIDSARNLILEGMIDMTWIILNFGKYAGRTLPQILLLDPDWFFWMLPKFYGQLAEEARDLARKARAIKIPGQNRETWVVEYDYDENQRFLGFWFVSPERPPNSSFCRRSRYLDLSRIRDPTTSRDVIGSSETLDAIISDGTSG